MEDLFKIYIDRLKVGEEEIIEEIFSPAFMEINEKELIFSSPIHVSGKVYRTDEELFLDLSMKTEALMPCSICNEMSKTSIVVKHFCHEEELKNIRSGIFNFKHLVREAILLEVPHIVKCQGDNCPEQEHLVKYLKKNKMEEEKHSFHPFADL